MADTSDLRDKPERYRHLFYEGEPAVFVNKLGIRDQSALNNAEKLALHHAYVHLQSGRWRVEGTLTAKYLLDLHASTFGHIYEWAGKPRGINLAPWSPPAFIQQNLVVLEKNHLAKYPLDKLHSDQQFCLAAAEIHGEFIPVHPFIDGNGRTIRMAIDGLALATGRPVLQYDRSPEGKAAYIQASNTAFHSLNYQPLADLLGQALDRAQTLQGEQESRPKQGEPRIAERIEKLKTRSPDVHPESDNPKDPERSR